MYSNPLEGNYLINQIYNVGIYLRLSREDENNFESASISNQRDFLTKYVLDNSWKLIETYIDDGWSGTTFDRPAFKQMLQDIENKKINMVIVKDLSRLGRNTSRVIDFIDEYFPIHNVRFIAVNDGIDTFADNMSNSMSPFLAVMHDMYCRDISKKVRTTFNIKRQKGEFIGSYAPYGYKKDSNNKNKLLIDEETAPIVRRIFDMFIKGVGYKPIAQKLNEELIPSPTAYKAIRDGYYHGTNRQNLWSGTMIKYIITNQTYCGNITQNKYSKINYKTKKLKPVPKKFWITIKDTHDPIINNETYDQAQKVAQCKHGCDGNNYKGESKHLLQGIVYCGDCGSRMTFERCSKGRYYVICSKYFHFSKQFCTRHSIRDDILEEYIFNELRIIADKAIDIKRMEEMVKSKAESSNSAVDKEINHIHSRLDEILRSIKSLYDDKVKGLFGENDFVQLSNEYIKERQILTGKLIELEERKQQQQQIKNSGNHKKLLTNFLELNTISKSDLAQLIDRIVIYEDGKEKRVEINYNFKNPFL